MSNFKNWLWLFLFGSFWGMSEVLGGNFLSNHKVPHASVLLATFAFFVLAIARGILNKPGSSTIIAVFASFFKLANAAPFFCHLLGIFFLGLAFDVFSSILIKNDRKTNYKIFIAGALSAYGGYALFALVITYIVRYEFWTLGGLPKVINHIFVSGSFSALVAMLIVPLGFRIGINSRILEERNPRWIYAGVAAALAIIWTLGRIVG
jgi:hypothetical protein